MRPIADLTRSGWCAGRAGHDPSLVASVGGPAAVAKGLTDAAGAFASTYWVAACLVALTLVPALFLPREREESDLLDDADDAPPVLIH